MLQSAASIQKPIFIPAGGFPGVYLSFINAMNIDLFQGGSSSTQGAVGGVS